MASAKSFILNGFKSQFFGESNLFLVRLLMVSFFHLWPKSSQLKSFIVFGSIVFRFGSHTLALLVQAGLIKPIRTATS